MGLGPFERLVKTGHLRSLHTMCGLQLHGPAARLLASPWHHFPSARHPCPVSMSYRDSMRSAAVLSKLLTAPALPKLGRRRSAASAATAARRAASSSSQPLRASRVTRFANQHQDQWQTGNAEASCCPVPHYNPALGKLQRHGPTYPPYRTSLARLTGASHRQPSSRVPRNDTALATQPPRAHLLLAARRVMCIRSTLYPAPNPWLCADAPTPAPPPLLTSSSPPPA